MVIAVVGHGTSPVGKRWGAKIDACDVVVRMWDWSWQRMTLADYGEKYSYGVVALIDFSTKPFLAERKTEPEIGWLGYARGKCDLSKMPKMEIIGQRFRDEAEALARVRRNGNLTRGCAAACWALEATEDEVVLVGFDNLKAGRALPTEEAFPAPVLDDWDRRHSGWRGRLYKEGRFNGSHDLSIERPYLERLSKTRGVALHFADDLWRVNK